MHRSRGDSSAIAIAIAIASASRRRGRRRRSRIRTRRRSRGEKKKGRRRGRAYTRFLKRVDATGEDDLARRASHSQRHSQHYRQASMTLECLFRAFRAFQASRTSPGLLSNLFHQSARSSHKYLRALARSISFLRRHNFHA